MDLRQRHRLRLQNSGSFHCVRAVSCNPPIDVIRFTSAARQQAYTCQVGPVSGFPDLEASMTALAIVIARALFKKEAFETRTLKLLALLCCAGLLLSMLLIIYGVAFSSDFF